MKVESWDLVQGLESDTMTITIFGGPPMLINCWVMALLLPLTWWLTFPSPSSLCSSSVDLLRWCMFEWLPQRYAHSSRKSKRKFLPQAQHLDCTQSTGGNPSRWQRTSAGSLWVAILSLYKVHNMSHNYLKPTMTFLYINMSASWIC